jgi:hypothetical protein
MERLTQLGAGHPAGQAQEGDCESPLLSMMSHHDARSGFAEAYRSVRTALQFSTREGAPRQLMVTSTGPTRKTTAAIARDQFRAD